MDKREANIDLVFRNGLKDFEVIPPSDVWESIHPVIKTKNRQAILLRAAASIAVLFTLSFLTYEWSRMISSAPESIQVALNSGIVPTSDSFSDNSKPFTSKLINTVAGKERIQVQITPIGDNKENKLFYISPEALSYQETENIQVNFTDKKSAPLVANLNKSQKNTFKISNSDIQFSLVNTPQKVVERWSISAMASPTYYSHLNAGGNEITKQLMSTEQSIISYSGGVAFSYKISKRVSIQSGLYYASLGQVVDGINSYTGFQKFGYSKGDHNFEVLTTNGTVYTRNSDVFLASSGPIDRINTNYTSEVFDPNKANLKYINSSISQNFSYLEVPVLVRYKIIDKTIDFNLIGGVSYNLLVNNSVYTRVNGSKYAIGETEKLNPISISSTLGMGMEYNFSEKLSLNIEPTLRYYLNPISGSAGVNVHPYSFGIFSGFAYRF
jgi:hypothetical protein